MLTKKSNIMPAKKKSFKKWLEIRENNKPRKGMKTRWSLKYKKNINCSNPKGFSQKNYCKRQKRGGKYLEFKEGIEIETPEAKALQYLVDTGEYRSKDCYICSRRFAMKIKGDYVEGILIGGYPSRKILHAWVEKNDFVYDPTIPEALLKNEYYERYKVKVNYRAEGIKATLKSARENKPGPIGPIPDGFKLVNNEYEAVE